MNPSASPDVPSVLPSDPPARSGAAGRNRLTALVTAIAIVNMACTNDEGLDAASSGAVESSTGADEGEGADPTGDDPAGAVGESSEVSTGSARGGASSDVLGDDVEVVTDDPRSGLNSDVAAATEPWPTDWTRRTIDLAELQLGIPTIDPRDRIRPIDEPTFEPIAEATWLDPREPGALVRLEGETRFYPLSIMTRHEIVNDRIGDTPVVVTYCPLCNTAISFDARVDGDTLRFGVSGLLRNSDLVMWDDRTTSLWQQITGDGIVGELAGVELEQIPTAIVAYGDVVENFPDAISLSRDTGFGIPYGANPYSGYSSSETPFLLDGEPDTRFPPLSRVVGVTIDDDEKAYPFGRLAEEGTVNDEVGGVPIVVLFGGDTADALDAAQIAESDTIGSGIAYDARVDGELLTFTPTDGDRFVDDQTGTTWTLLGRAVEGPLEGAQLETVQHRNEFWFAWARFFPDAPVYGEE